MGQGNRRRNVPAGRSESGVLGIGGELAIDCRIRATVGAVALDDGDGGQGALVSDAAGSIALVSKGIEIAWLVEDPEGFVARLARCMARGYTYRGHLHKTASGAFVVDVGPDG